MEYFDEQEEIILEESDDEPISKHKRKRSESNSNKSSENEEESMVYKNIKTRRSFLSKKKQKIEQACEQLRQRTRTSCMFLLIPEQGRPTFYADEGFADLRKRMLIDIETNKTIIFEDLFLQLAYETKKKLREERGLPKETRYTKPPKTARRKLKEKSKKEKPKKKDSSKNTNTKNENEEPSDVELVLQEIITINQ